MEKELIEFLNNDQELHWKFSGKDFEILENSIHQFFSQYQPERSKREDDKTFNSFICGNCSAYKLSLEVCRCGALNSMET